MRLEYFPDTDSLYVCLHDAPSVESREISDGFVIDFDEQGRVVGLDIDHASKKLDFEDLDVKVVAPNSDEFILEGDPRLRQFVK